MVTNKEEGGQTSLMDSIRGFDMKKFKKEAEERSKEKKIEDSSKGTSIGGVNIDFKEIRKRLKQSGLVEETNNEEENNNDDEWEEDEDELENDNNVKEKEINKDKTLGQGLNTNLKEKKDKVSKKQNVEVQPQNTGVGKPKNKKGYTGPKLGGGNYSKENKGDSKSFLGSITGFDKDKLKKYEKKETDNSPREETDNFSLASMLTNALKGRRKAITGKQDNVKVVKNTGRGKKVKHSWRKSKDVKKIENTKKIENISEEESDKRTLNI